MANFLEAAGWYASIFVWLYCTGIGLPPCPEEAGIGYAAWLTAVHPNVHWWWAWPAAGVAVLCADMTLYGVGRWCGSSLFEYRWVQRIIKPERRQRFEHLFHSHGTKILLTARLLPPLRTGVFVVAGALSFPFVHFVIADAIYAVFGVGLLFFCGAGLLSLLHQYVHHWLTYLVAAGVIAYLVYRYYRRLRVREVRLSTPELVTVPAPASVVEAVQDSVPPRPPEQAPEPPRPAPPELSALLKR
jgi:membrane protein DedA with SNARE-associated domain